MQQVTCRCYELPNVAVRLANIVNYSYSDLFLKPRWCYRCLPASHLIIYNNTFFDIPFAIIKLNNNKIVFFLNKPLLKAYKI